MTARCIILALALMLSAALPSAAAIAVVNSTTCITAASAPGKIACPIKAPQPADLLVVVYAGAGGGQCALSVVSAFAIDFAPGACYGASYILATKPVQPDIVLLNPGGVDAVIAVILELSGTSVKAPVDTNSLYINLATQAACSTTGLTPANDGEFALAYAVNASSTTLTSYTTTPDEKPASVSAVGGGKSAVRLDVGTSPAPAGGLSVFGTFTYGASTPCAAGLVLIR